MPTPIENIRQDRIKKLEALIKMGVNPYPSVVSRTNTNHEVLAHFKDLAAKKTKISLAGRIMSLRRHGGMAFVDLKDETAKIQVFISKKEITEKKFEEFKLLDVGDFLEVNGILFETQAGEKTLQANKIKLLAKSLRPIPDKHFGLKDEEKKYRQRYLDLLLNEDLKNLFRRKAKFMQKLASYFIKKGFTQVYTPTLECEPAGADAVPFKTHMNALDIDLYLRICTGELWQKRLMIAGFEKTFEIGQEYRNEGMSPEHLQEFLDIEWYWAYANYQNGMKLTQDLYRYLAKEVYGKTAFTIGKFKVDLAKKWPEIDYRQAIKEKTGLDIEKTTIAEIRKKLMQLDVKFEDSQSVARLIDSLWKYCRRQISGPAFLVNHPVSVSPLAKRRIEDPKQVERFQVILAGSELGNGYSELTDPIDQENRFKEQDAMRIAGDEEAQHHDFDFVKAMEYGMPPICGFGMSERLFWMFEGRSGRECTMFPLVRPCCDDTDPAASKACTPNSKKNRPKPSQSPYEDKKIIVLLNEKIDRGIAFNVIGHITTSIGHYGENLMGREWLTDAQGTKHKGISRYPVIILKAKDNKIKEIVAAAREKDLLVVDFPEEMYKTRTDDDLAKAISRTDENKIKYYGAGFFGATEIINPLTKKFSLWK
jgi:lysyl-tRNA synthetase, class II